LLLSLDVGHLDDKDHYAGKAGIFCIHSLDETSCMEWSGAGSAGHAMAGICTQLARMGTFIALE